MKNKRIDFSQCEFIEENMQFMTYIDFCNNKYIIKHLFEQLDDNGKIFYKWYVYANIHMKETFKNAIWDYLNGYDLNGIELMRITRIYKDTAEMI